jgi:exodeoxyribonuclease-3
MAELTICSWNINGLRASIKTGDFQRWLTEVSPDVVGLQEVKAAPDQVDDCWSALGYESHWHTADRPGYSGALLLSRPKPAAVRIGLGIPEFDVEGRVIQADYGDLTVLTSYFPNAGRGVERMDYKLRFYASFLDTVDRLVAAGRHVVFMGDFNVAHTEMDVARPQEALKGTGFLPEERAWLDRIVASGYADTFRRQHPDERDAYSYWDPWRDRRARNIGWRIDYVFVDATLMPRVKRSFIQPEYMGSDHCPVGIELEV